MNKQLEKEDENQETVIHSDLEIFCIQIGKNI
jgi:hypothetical protein